MSAGTGWKAGLASLAMLAVATAGSVGLVAAHDIDLSLTSPTEEMAADESQAVPTLVGTDSPAMLAVQEVLTTAPQGWEVAEDAPRMGTQRAWWPAVEHSGSPVVAGSVVMSSPAGDVVVDAAAYPAGLGAVAMEEKAAVAEPSNGPGAQGAVAASSWNGASFTTESWRRGDVIITLAYGGGRDPELAQEVDAVLASALAGRCANEESTIEQAVRSPLHSDYEGWLSPRTVEIDPPGLPEWDGPTMSLEVALEPVALVERPAVPSYPVWPPLPEAVAEPVAPTPPGEPVTEANYVEQVRDRVGPGCGWDFTGSVEPVFDEATAEAEAEAAARQALSELEAGAEQWQRDVLAYWQGVEDYREQAAEYRAYTEEVAQVSAAWDVIAGQWQRYWGELAAYEQAVAEREDFLARQARAQEDYDRLIERCEQLAEEAEDETDVEQPSPPPAPEDGPVRPPHHPKPGEVNGKQSCQDIERPAILDQPAPPEPLAPTEPADPRPVSEQ